jgi:hypothetical protein
MTILVAIVLAAVTLTVIRTGVRQDWENCGGCY